jgi:CheY-like chemotaxis protein
MRDRKNSSFSGRLLAGARGRLNDLAGNRDEGAAPRILLVDDAPVNLAASCRMLGRLGCQVDPASTGEFAVAMFRDGCPEARYDMILLDLNMPGMNGMETARSIRSVEAELAPDHPYRSRPVPILALTSYNPGDRLQEYLAAGMNDFMYKPFQPEVVRDALLRWVSIPA